MNKKTLIAGLVLFAGAPVAAQVNDVDPNSDTQIARRTVRVNPEAERAPVARSNPIDLGGVVYWGSSRGVPRPPLLTHQIHAFDAAGVLGVSIDQIAAAQSSAWGYRDGASDGTFIYFGWEGGVARHDADGSNGVLLFGGFSAPGGIYRALAFDPTGDGGRGSFRDGLAARILRIETGRQVDHDPSVRELDAGFLEGSLDAGIDLFSDLELLAGMGHELGAHDHRRGGRPQPGGSWARHGTPDARHAGPRRRTGGLRRRGGAAFELAALRPERVEGRPA